MNLIQNPSFGYPDARGNIIPSLAYWSKDVPSTWYSGVKAGISAAQCDQDMPREIIVGWPIGIDGHLWQDITPNVLHSEIQFTLSEQQHHGSNTAVITIYGFINGEWQELWIRNSFNDVPVNTLENRTTWYTNTYTIPVPIPYEKYRVEFHGRIDSGIPPHENCGWKFTNLILEVS